MFPAIAESLDGVSGPDHAGRLRPHPVDLHVTGSAGVRGSRAGLVHPYGPEPLVHPCPGLLGAAGGHAARGGFGYLAHQSAARAVEPLTL